MQDYSVARTAMVDRQVRPSDVTSYPIIDAMLTVPRERFIPSSQHGIAYADAAISLANGREILEPRTFAKLLDGARIGPDDLVLDLAPGLGYSTAVIARMAAAVIAVEPDEAMAAQGAEICAALEIDNVMVRAGDPAAGDPGHGPFDAIFIGGGIAVPVDQLLGQLKDGGRIVAVDMSGGAGAGVVYVRSGAILQRRRLFDASARIIPGFEAVEEFSL